MAAGARNAAAQPRAVDDRTSDEKLRPLVSGSFTCGPWPSHGTSRDEVSATESFFEIRRPELRRTLAEELLALPSGTTRHDVRDERCEPDRVEGLQDVAEGAELLRAATVVGRGARGEEDDRNLVRALVGVELLRHRPPVEARHHQVEEDDVRLLGTRELERLLAVRRLDDLHACDGQVDLAEQPDRRLVVGDEDSQPT